MSPTPLGTLCLASFHSWLSAPSSHIGHALWAYSVVVTFSSTFAAVVVVAVTIVCDAGITGRDS
jgi:hypothetical protein